MSRFCHTTVLVAAALLLSTGPAVAQPEPPGGGEAAPEEAEGTGAEAEPESEGMGPEAAPEAEGTGAEEAPKPEGTGASPVIEREAPYPSPAGAPPPAAVGPQVVSPPVSAGTAVAPEPAELEPGVGPEPLGTHQEHFQVMLGVRTSFIGHEGYDPFSDNDSLFQVALGGGLVVLPLGDFSLAAIGLWEYGGSSAEARGEPTDLDVHRLSLGPELRYHLTFWLYAFARPSLAVLNTRASIEESVTGTTLYSRRWGFGLDATAGAALQLYGKRSGASHKPRLWVIAEGGYGWGSPKDLRLSPEEDDELAPQRMADLELGELAIHGPMFRVSVALTF